MLIDYKKNFLKKISKIKDNSFKDKIIKQAEKIINSPEIGKPMRYDRRETREIYIMHYRLAYAYDKKKNKLIFLEIYHKDEQ